MSAFEVGELATFAVATTAEGLLHVGKIVEVVMIGPWPDFPETEGREYACNFPDDPTDPGSLVFGWQLRKLEPPEEPASLTRIHEEPLEAVS